MKILRGIEKNIKEIERAIEDTGFKIKLLKVDYVKSFKPRIGHYVLGLEVDT